MEFRRAATAAHSTFDVLANTLGRTCSTPAPLLWASHGGLIGCSDSMLSEHPTQVGRVIHIPASGGIKPKLRMHGLASACLATSPHKSLLHIQLLLPLLYRSCLRPFALAVFPYPHMATSSYLCISLYE